MTIKTMPLEDIRSDEMTSAQNLIRKDGGGTLNRTMQRNDRINFFNFDRSSYDQANVGSSSMTELTQIDANGTGDGQQNSDLQDRLNMKTEDC